MKLYMTWKRHKHKDIFESWYAGHGRCKEPELQELQHSPSLPGMINASIH